MRLGFALDKFDAQTRELKGKMAETADHIVEHANRPRAATMAFHKALHEVTKISPLVGEALQLALNPVVGIILAGVAALAHLAEKFKEIQTQSKELQKTFQEFVDWAAKPIDSMKSIAEAKAKADKAAAADARAMAKEQNELNDPIERMLKNLKRQEELFDDNKDAAAKLAAQQKALAQIQSEITPAQQGVAGFESPEAQAGRKELERLKALGEARIKEKEKDIEAQKKIQEKYKDLADEQAKIDEDYTTHSGAFPNINKALAFGDTNREDAANQYKAAVEQQAALESAIEETRGSIAKYDEQLNAGHAEHEEQLSGLRKLISHQEQLRDAIHRTQVEMQKQRLEEGRQTIQNRTETGLNEIEEKRTRGELNILEAAKASHALRVKQIRDERDLEAKSMSERLAGLEKERGAVGKMVGQMHVFVNDEGTRYRELTDQINSTRGALDKLNDTPLKVISDREVDSARERMEKLQKEFDRNRAKLEEEKKRSEMEPFLPTIEALSKIPGWGGRDAWRFQMPQLPHFLSPEAEQAGEMARELRSREADLRETNLNEGPKSDRAKEDLARINELKRSLEKSGFIKEDHTENISRRMDELLERAKGDGLVVKPMMGE
jgi:chromosome segregation ATPase